MGTIIIHAGMPKAGSTSVQRWITAHVNELREKRDTRVVVATSQTEANPTDRVHVEEYRSGLVNSGRMIRRYLALGRHEDIAARFFGELHEFANRHSTIVVTSEGFAQPFWEVDPTFLGGLDELARSHPVRVAYYVRPQHTALEAGWRQFGFRQGVTPSSYTLGVARSLDYLGTLDEVQRMAPHVALEPRPFRPDLLAEASVSADFAIRFLGATELVSDDAPHRIENRGLPLDLVNMLRQAPPGLLWSNTFDNRTLDRLKPIFAGLELEEGTKIRRSRQILQAYAYQEFEPGNRQLIDRLTWPTKDYVPPVPSGLDDPWGIAELDTLWTPDASDIELGFLFRALRTFVEQQNAAPSGARVS